MNMASASLFQCAPVDESAMQDAASTITLFGVKFDSWSFTLPEDDFVMEGVTFKAMRISSEEQG